MSFAAVPALSAGRSVVSQPGLAPATALLLVAAALCVNVLACRMCYGRLTATPGVHRARRIHQARRCVLDGDDAAREAQAIEIDTAGASDSSDDVLGCAERETSTRAARLPARAKRKVKSESQQAPGEGGARTLNVLHEYLE